MENPVVGVTRCSRLDDYLKSIVQAGGRVRVLEVRDDPGAALDEVDAVLLTGGGDVNPRLYGEARHPTVRGAEPGRDEFEIELAQRAMEADVPLLAICRGLQVLNVAAGGTLVQDIPTAVAGALPHSVTEPSDVVAHTVNVREESRVRAALGPSVGESSECRVNSRHHQSVGRVGKGLVISASAADGVIEAVEAPAARFCVGVQWHPENFWRTGEFNELFGSFVDAARERLAGASGAAAKSADPS